MESLKERLKEKEKLQIEADEIINKFKGIIFDDPDYYDQIEEREREWNDWEERFRENYEAITRLEKEGL